MAKPLSSNLPWELAGNIWAQSLNPILINELLQGALISNIVLAATTPKTISHGLGRQMIGWFPVDNTASATIWRTSPLNSINLTLEASAATTIALWVF